MDIRPYRTENPDCTLESMSASRTPRFLAVPAILLIALLSVLTAVPASAATVTRWATWGALEGAGGAYTTSVSIADNPALSATVTSDSRAGQVGVISGSSTWLAASTPVGEKYGSSKDQPYLNLRPRVDNASSPSTTTYTFSRPTPTTGWTFVLGDIDADRVRISATAADGTAVSAEQLGFRDGFNYCADGLAGKPSCAGDAADVPSWDPATLTLTGNAGATDTSGAAAWFEPTTPLATLTFEFTQRSGFPIYQTWFASLARDITGTVVAPAGSEEGVTLTLTDPAGTVIATTTSGPGGTYGFTGIQASDGYTVSVTPPAGLIVDGPVMRAANLSAADAVADFALRAPVPVTVSGTVRDAEGAGVPGAVITIPGVGDATTGADGGYAFPEVPPGEHTASITDLPDGYIVDRTPPSFTVPAGSETPITDVDFTLAQLGAITGTVTNTGGDPVSGVTLTVTGPGEPQSLTSGPDGSYALKDLPPGEYAITVDVPEGYTSADPATRTVTITGTGETIADQDFALTPSVQPVDPPAPGTGGGALPATGAEPSGPLALGGILLLAGVLSLAVAHGRRRLTN